MMNIQSKLFFVVAFIVTYSLASSEELLAQSSPSFTITDASTGAGISSICAGTIVKIEASFPFCKSFIYYWLTSGEMIQMENGDHSSWIKVRFNTSGSHDYRFYYTPFTSSFVCPGAKAEVGVIRNISVETATPSAGTIISQTICAGSSTSLSASNVIGSVFRWEKKLPSQLWSEAVWINSTSTTLGNLADNTTTNYRIVVGSSCAATVYAYADVTVNSLQVPPIPTNGDISTNCSQLVPIGVSTNYPAGFTIWHYYYEEGSQVPLAEVLAQTSFTSTVYVSSYQPTSFSGSKNFLVEAKVIGTGGCADRFSGKKMFTYTLGGIPQPPAGLNIYYQGNPVTQMNICSGETLNLAASNGTSNYVWRDDSGNEIGSGSSVSFIPGQNGVYHVSANWNNGCGGSSIITGAILINRSSPSAAIAGSGSSFCVGSTPSFNINFSNGSANTTYHWTLNEYSGQSDAFQLSSSLAEGSYILSASVAADFPGQCLTRKFFNPQISIEIKPIPSIPTVTGNTRFGIGALTLTAGGIYPIPTYKWYKDSNVTQGSMYSVSSITQSEPSYVAVSATAVNGCEGNKNYVNINILDAPTIIYDGPNYIPVGGTTKLTTQVLDYDSYIWKDGIGTFIGGSNKITIVRPDNYSLVVSKGGATANVSINVGDNTSNQNINFVRETSIQKRGVMDPSSIASLPITDKSQQTQYLDGLGRPVLNVNTQGSPGKLDILLPIVYDSEGREFRKFLPVAFDNSGRFKEIITDASYSGEAAGFYNGSQPFIATDPKPFSELKFDSSPLNRPQKIGAPGQVWQPSSEDINDKSIKKDYKSNGENEVLLIRYQESSSTITLPAEHYYQLQTLYANTTYDETNNIIIEYTDKEGRTICKKVQSGGTQQAPEFAETYYIYDDFGNLVVVLPPEGVKKLKQNLNLN